MDGPATDFDVAILGAGAAGLCAAIRAAERGRRVVLLEKNRRPGVKILMSGGTRCNITNARGLRNIRVVSGGADDEYDPREARGARSIQAAFGEAGGRFLGPALKSLSVEDTVSLFEAEGVATKIEGNGKVFPVSDRAVDVLDALLRRLQRSGATLRTNSPATDVQHHEDQFLIQSGDALYRAPRVILAMGGQSFPGCGTTGDGFAIARGFGHPIRDVKPALVPLRVEADWVATLSGITAKDVRAAIVDAEGRVVQERREAVLFAHFGLTGPAILDVSRAVARAEDPRSTRLELDFYPDARAEALAERLQVASRQGRPNIPSLVPEPIPRRLAEALVAAAGIPPGRIGPELSRDERKRLVHALKQLRLPVASTLGFAKAEVTSGGIVLDEVNSESLESRRQPGLHFAGEVLDLDGLIGGYNFQAAWSTGWLAGESV